MRLFDLRILGCLVCIIAAIFLQAPLVLLAQATDQTEQWQQEHERKREEKRTLEEQRNTIIQKEQGVLQKLQEIESQLAANEKELARYQQEIDSHTFEVEELQRELGELLSQDKRQKKLAVKRIRTIYKLGYNEETEHILKILLGAQDMQDLVEKYKYMGVIAEADQNLLKDIQIRQAEIAEKSTEIRQQIQLAKAASEAAEIERSNLLDQEQKRQQLLHQYRTEKGVHNQAIRELNAAVAQLGDRLGIISEARIEKQADTIRSIRTNRFGKLPWPVVGKVVANQNPTGRGITIQAKKGTPVRCVAKGVVVNTGQVFGYGNTVLVMHGDGYISVYAHLSSISVTRGDTTQEKQVLGTLGGTGSLIGPVLYLELWKNQEPLNTRRWLTRKMK